MILGVPVVDQHESTDRLIDSLALTVNQDFRLVLIDNDSRKPYKKPKGLPFPVDLIKNGHNRGYYWPLLQLYKQYPKEELIGLIHNDMVLYEPAWNVRMTQCFNDDPLLGLVGLCGSNEVDSLGGRGSGTMCFFRGEVGQSQDAGARIHDLQPSLILDSLFMMFRREVVPHLGIDNDITLAHFYDRIWPLRTIDAGYRVATLGIECDHIGGVTATGNERYRQDCIDWLEERGIPYENPETEMYLVAERRYLEEFREGNHWIPAQINLNWEVNHLERN